MPGAIFAKPDARGWIGNQAFETSPILQKIPPGPGIGNGSTASWQYIAYIWYHLQLVLNDGQGAESDNNPIDFPYVFGSVKDELSNGMGLPAANIELMWLIKSLQEETQKGGGPELGPVRGFVPTTVSPIDLAYGSWEKDWAASSKATRVLETTAYLQAWFAQISSYTPTQYYTGQNGGGGHWATASLDPGKLDGLTSFGGQNWFMLPRFRWLGVDPALVAQITAWAATVWPAGNWAANLAATCTNINKCTSDGL